LIKAVIPYNLIARIIDKTLGGDMPKKRNTDTLKTAGVT